jgi:indolepyruvate decarboxylase
MVLTRGIPNHRSPEPEEASDPDSLEEALAEARVMINEAEKPVILAGVELHRFGLQDALLELLRKTNIPVAATLQSKSVLGERHPLFLGIYEGAMGREDVREYVETSDCLILLGALMSDVDLGIFTAHLDPSRSIYVTSEKASIRFHNYENIRLEDFLRSLLRVDLVRREPVPIPHAEAPGPFTPVPREKITVQRLFQRLNAFLEDDTIVIADPGEALFASADLFIHGRTEFLAPAYYTSMGFGVPAALGAQLADPKLRPLVLVGDGAFQMTGMELSTIARFGLSPIVVVLNNRGYSTERPMQDGTFNDLLEWKYSRIPEILGSGKGFEVETEGDLEAALRFSRDYTQGFCLLDVHLDPFDTSPASKRLTSALAKKVH